VGHEIPAGAALMGVMPGLKCFIAAVIGGIGNIKGSVIADFCWRLGEILLVASLPALTGYRTPSPLSCSSSFSFISPPAFWGAKKRRIRYKEDGYEKTNESKPRVHLPYGSCHRPVRGLRLLRDANFDTYTRRV
jgi:hypothetical protein